jgi:hypothetical protein
VHVSKTEDDPILASIRIRHAQVRVSHPTEVVFTRQCRPAIYQATFFEALIRTQDKSRKDVL